jgi:hypothetical protein
MPDLEDPVVLRRLAALHDLEDESFLAVVEAHAARAVLADADRRFARRPRTAKADAQRERLALEVRREIAELQRYLSQVVVTEVTNWRFVAEQQQKALEEVSLWRPVIPPSVSKPLFPSRTATTTGSSST